jgi:hypothetical protein
VGYGWSKKMLRLVQFTRPSLERGKSVCPLGSVTRSMQFVD